MKTNHESTEDPRPSWRCPGSGSSEVSQHWSTNQSMKATGRLSVSQVREHHGVHGIFTHLDLELVMSCQKCRWRGA